MSHALGHLASLPVVFYQRAVSPWLGPRCRYAPTCSAYAVEALRTHGLVKGTVLTAWRLLRCNPWSHGGVDHVPSVGRWRPEEWVPPADWPGHDLDDPSRSIDPPMGMTRMSVPSSTMDAVAPASADLPAAAGTIRDAHASALAEGASTCGR